MVEPSVDIETWACGIYVRGIKDFMKTEKDPVKITKQMRESMGMLDYFLSKLPVKETKNGQ